MQHLSSKLPPILTKRTIRFNAGSFDPFSNGRQLRSLSQLDDQSLMIKDKPESIRDHCRFSKTKCSINVLTSNPNLFHEKVKLVTEK